MADIPQVPGGAPPKAGPFRFFINYRRRDNADFVEHIRSWFAWHFGRPNVFMDFDSIPAGADFPEFIRQEVRRCDALLAIIGPEWVKAIREKPHFEKDWVRIEIREALERNKLVVPICIKGATMPVEDDLPAYLRGLLTLQAAEIESGPRFAHDIELAMSSIQERLEARQERKARFDKADANPPAAGLALGYYMNFVRTVGTQLGEAGQLKIGDKTLDLETQPVRLQIVIPHRLELLRPETLAAARRPLEQATLESKTLGRPLTLRCRPDSEGWLLVDFPATAAAIENWLQRRLSQEAVRPESDEARKLEEQQLDEFESVLRYWIDDQANVPAFRKRVQVVRFKQTDPGLDWLAQAWGLEG